MSVADVLELLATSSSGLADSEAAIRVRRYGLNRPPRPKPTRWYVELGREFVHLFALLLWAAAVFAWWLNMPELGVAVVLVIVINGGFSYWQQYRAEQAVQALESLLPQQVRVRRRGVERAIVADDVALGDIVLLAEGSAVPADARIVSAERLRVDMSSLTGESKPLGRVASPCPATGRTVAELGNIVLAGTYVTSGRAEAVVYATGAQTEFGRLAALTNIQPVQDSPLQREMRRITRIITVLAVGMGLVMFLVGWLVGRLSWTEGVLFALGIIVANVPEGLLPTLSLSLAIGVRRMAARRAIVKRLERVEALGAVTVIVTDKTGTLTHNQMTVRGLWCAGQNFEVSGAGYEPVGEIRAAADAPQEPADWRELLRVAALCCDARLRPPDGSNPRWTVVGDPTEGAVLAAAAKAGLTAEKLAELPRLAELPFDSVRKRMATIHDAPGGRIVCAKGAASELLPRCTQVRGGGRLEANGEARQQLDRAARRFADHGWRVLAVATRFVAATDLLPAVGDADADAIERDLTFLGFIAMEDPPRAEVPAAIGSCRAAGIRVIMATGDDGHTAQAIGREIGWSDGARILTGTQLDRTDDRTLGLLLGHRDVLFARVTPAHKLRLVEALQKRGEVVVVTGDGVNDAPALKRADVGVAMGASGTDVARAAADVILLDDNFATIVAAIEEGRAVYDNVRKFITYIFASNVPELVPFIAFVLGRIPLPLTVMQILAVDLGTDLLPALALGVEPPEPHLMRRPPRARNRPLLDSKTLLRAYGWLGAIEAVLGLSGFFVVYWLAGWRPPAPLPAAGPLYLMATTMSLSGIVACQLGNALACRSEHRSVCALGLGTNRALLWAMAVELLTLLALIYVPPLPEIFHLTPLEPRHWLVLAAFGPLLLALEELRKKVAGLMLGASRHEAGPG